MIGGFQSKDVTKDWQRVSWRLTNWGSIVFQSIGVTKDWRPGHSMWCGLGRHSGFQSIGVTRDWRRPRPACSPSCMPSRFPIKRRHQRLATPDWESLYLNRAKFPIKRRHQGLAIPCCLHQETLRARWFPINRRHQGLATSGKFKTTFTVCSGFPINRRHQGLATPPPSGSGAAL